MASTPLERLFWSTARGRLDARAVQAAFEGDERLDAIARMAIYRDMYFARQLSALADSFPRVTERLGADAFQRLGRRYLLAHPSRTPALEWVGERFADFLGGEPNAAVRGLEGVARLEWLACAAQLAPDEPRAEPGSLAPERWPRARLRLLRSLATVVVERAAYASFAGTELPGEGPIDVAVFRAGYRVRHVVLGDDEARALQLAAQGRALAEICAVLGELERAHSVIAGWLARGWITAMEEV